MRKMRSQRVHSRHAAALVSVQKGYLADELNRQLSVAAGAAASQDDIARHHGVSGNGYLTEATVVHLGLACRIGGIRRRFDLVVTSEMCCEVLLAGEDMAAYRTLVVALQH